MRLTRVADPSYQVIPARVAEVKTSEPTSSVVFLGTYESSAYGV